VAVIYLLLTLGVGGILAWFGRRELTGLSHIYTKALNEHAEHGELLQQQAWLRTGQSELAQQGIGQLALPQLSSALLQFMARYMGVVVGAFYHARPRWQFPPRGLVWPQRRVGAADQQIKPAESLVAQAALERRILRLEPCRPITSRSLRPGAGAPASVLLAPVDSDGEVNGVIELGLLRRSARAISIS
jgi:hypothetical protein